MQQMGDWELRVGVDVQMQTPPRAAPELIGREDTRFEGPRPTEHPSREDGGTGGATQAPRQGA